MNYEVLSKLSFLDNVKSFLSSLTLIDVVFFFSVLLLMILVVVLLYFIKLNEDSIETIEEIKEEPAKEEVKETLTEAIASEKLIEDEVYNEENAPISTDEILKTDIYDDEEGELLDLEAITKKLEENKSTNVDLTSFEEEQEKEAIISYDELISKTRGGAINYKKESMIDDVSVKEVDLSNIVNSTSNAVIENKEAKVIRYDEEEAFLSALKTLQKQINI
ncbi:MAG: hypothetical protein K6G37_02625 [Bacilli bacterium]|nr:hypothetical protein [Bacilli bacterium]